MFTPQELRENKHFGKSVFGGYNIADVDSYVSAVAEDYSALYKENAVLKSQLKVVVDRLEDYRKQEDSMNKAMIAAQQAADELVAETERKCARMLSDSEQLLRKRKEELQAEIDEDTARVALVKRTAAEFLSEVQQQVLLCQSRLDRIRRTIGADDFDGAVDAVPAGDVLLPEEAAEASIPEPPATPGDPASMSREIDRNLGRILADMAAAREEGTAVDA